MSKNKKIITNDEIVIQHIENPSLHLLGYKAPFLLRFMEFEVTNSRDLVYNQDMNLCSILE